MVTFNQWENAFNADIPESFLDLHWRPRGRDQVRAKKILQDKTNLFPYDTWSVYPWEAELAIIKEGDLAQVTEIHFFLALKFTKKIKNTPELLDSTKVQTSTGCVPLFLSAPPTFVDQVRYLPDKSTVP